MYQETVQLVTKIEGKRIRLGTATLDLDQMSALTTLGVISPFFMSEFARYGNDYVLEIQHPDDWPTQECVR